MAKKKKKRPAKFQGIKTGVYYGKRYGTPKNQGRQTGGMPSSLEY